MEPIYNMEAFLPQCLDSILTQTYPDFEMWLVDDGSTDGSGSICDAYAVKDGRVHVCHKENGGLSSARNYGIDHARGDFIIFPDPDDWVEPGYLEGLLAIREKYHADLSICGHYVIDYSREKVQNPAATETILDTGDALDALMHPSKFCGYAWNKLYDMNVIRAHDLRFDKTLGMVQDLHFAVRYFLLCSRIAYDPEPLYHYRNGGATDAGSPLTARKMSALKTYLGIAQIVRESPYPQLEKVAYRSLFDIGLSNLYSYYYGKNRDPALLETLKDTLKTYQKYYYPNNVYSIRRRLAGRLALVSPRLYYTVLRVKRMITGQDRLVANRDRNDFSRPERRQL